MTDPIIKTIEVPCGPDRAFDIFVNRIANWWPLDGHAASAAAGQAALGVTIEPRVGGAIFETMYDGTRTDWGEIPVFEAGRKLSMTWHPGNNADSPTRVDVVFDGISEERTRVTLTHSGWEVWAEEAAAKRENYDKGWDFVLGECFGSAAAA